MKGVRRAWFWRMWVLGVGGITAVFLTSCAASQSEPVALVITPASVATVPPTPTLALSPSAEPHPPTPQIFPSATTAPTQTPTPITEAIETPLFTPTATPTITPTPCAEPGRVERGFFPSDIAGETSYQIYLPPCYGLDGRLYPTLYMLAGNTYTDALWLQLGLHTAAEEGIQDGRYPPIIIVMPYSGETALYTSGGPRSYETVILHDLTSFIEANYCASPDPQFRALGGVSRGGYWSLNIAFRHPDAFVSVGGHSAALLDEFARPDVNPQYTALSNDLGDLRIYLDIGDNDWVRANTIQLHEDMVAAGVPHDWFLNEGSHEEPYWAARVHDYLAWYTEPWQAVGRDLPSCDVIREP